MDKIIGIILGCILGISWIFPGTLFQAILTIIFCFGFIYLFTISEKKLCFFLIGFISKLIACYWLSSTVSNFGGFSLFLAILILLLYSAASGIFFLIIRYLYIRNKNLFLIPIFWFITERIFPDLFPWNLSHGLYYFNIQIQAVDIFGTNFLSLILLYFTIFIFLAFKEKNFKLIIIPIVLLSLNSFYGLKKIKYFNTLTPLENAYIIQANVSIDNKSNISFFNDNTFKYLELTDQISDSEKSGLILWPESVMMNWINLDNQDKTPLPNLSPNFNFLIGALTYKQRGANIFKYNSILSLENQKIVNSYHKEILMPFGEYMPFSNSFPILNNLNPQIPNFNKGLNNKLSNFNNYKLASLICYEDLIPKLASKYTKLGAQVLTSHSNDAWFGDSPAAKQHNLIASFRAIENRRWFLRSTNSGFSAVINPNGKIVKSLDLFKQGVIKTNFKPLDVKTVFNFLNINFISLILSILLLIVFTLKNFLIKK